MSIDLSSETTFPLLHACTLVPPARNGKRCHLSTLLRWIVKGVRSPSGQTVRLEAVRLGSRWLTSLEALQRFSERLTPSLGDGDAAPVPAPRTPRQRQRRAEKAGDELASMGI